MKKKRRTVPEGADDVGGSPRDRDPAHYNSAGKLRGSVYKTEMARLQEQLVLLQYWIQSQGLRVLVVFEGRGSAGKGGVIKTVTERTSPRIVRVVALPKPTERQRTQWYFQRYVEHLPSLGEMVLFDRSWYNRSNVEWVMGFCSEAEHELYVKYSMAKDITFQHTDIKQAPWFVVPSDDKKAARINAISHLLSCFAYEDVTPSPVALPDMREIPYVRPPLQEQTFVPQLY